MKQLAGLLLGPTILFLIGCHSQPKAPIEIPLKQEVTAMVQEPTMVFQSAVDGKPVTVDMQWGNYISKLDKQWQKRRHLYLKSTPLHKFIQKTYIKTAIRMHYKQKTLPYELVCMYAYAATEYPKKYKIDEHIVKGCWTHESGWATQAVCGKIRKDDGTYKLLAEDQFSYGVRQLEQGTSKEHFARKHFRHYDSKWLQDFPLVNMDISCKILREKHNKWKIWAIALQAYNGGDGGWKDGRSEEYLHSIQRIINANWPYWNLTKVTK